MNLAQYLAKMIDAETTHGELRGKDFDVDRMAADLMHYGDTHGIIRRGTPEEYVNEFGRDAVLERRGAYALKGHPGGLRIGHIDDLRREAKERRRKAIFGDDYVPMNGEARHPANAEHGGAWPNAQQHLMPGYTQPEHRYQ